MLKFSVTSKNGFNSQADINPEACTVIKNADSNKKFPVTLNFHEGAMLTVQTADDCKKLFAHFGVNLQLEEKTDVV